MLAVGAVQEKAPQWFRADFSNSGWWVDAVARGVNLESTFAKGKTKAAAGDTPQPATDPTWTFEGWAAWDGTSFPAPITRRRARPHDVAQRASARPRTRRTTC